MPTQVHYSSISAMPEAQVVKKYFVTVEGNLFSYIIADMPI